MRKPTISVVLATFNEEKNIKACLDSAQGLADEIIIVDGSSTDRTREIARKYGAKVIKTSNKPIFHINKQMAIDAAKGDWVLQLDADERATPELRAEILKTVKKTKNDGFWIPRRNYFLGRYLKKGGQYPDYTLRLYRRGKGRLPCKTVHEQAEVKGQAGYLQSDLLHWADPNFSRYLIRFGRYTDLIADELERGKVKLGLLTTINYWFIKPFAWFFKTFFRHKGFLDGFQGFVFSLFSSLRFVIGYTKYWQRKNGT